MNKFISTLLLLTSFSILQAQVQATDSTQFYQIYHKGDKITIDSLISHLKQAKVVFMGENHDDATAHELEMEVFARLFAEHNGNISLAMEMFEKDVQTTIDEYVMKGMIREKDFLASTRPWSNYTTDYRPLIEFARQNKIRVLGSNAPSRYVSAVGRLGKQVLDLLSPETFKWIAPAAYLRDGASPAYAEKFNRLMGDMGGHVNPNMLDAQNLRDATMAHTLIKLLTFDDFMPFLHINGSFHSEGRMGIPDFFNKYAPEIPYVVVTMISADDIQQYQPEQYNEKGDFIILTDAKRPRSYESRF